jgi:hypothetical protein
MKLSPWIIHTSNKILSKSLFNIWDPEFWHKIMMQKLDSLEKIEQILDIIWESLYFEDSSLNREIWNMTFKNPVWIAPGFVKQPHWLKFLEKLWVYYKWYSKFKEKCVWWLYQSCSWFVDYRRRIEYI